MREVLTKFLMVGVAVSCVVVFLFVFLWDKTEEKEGEVDTQINNADWPTSMIDVQFNHDKFQLA